VKEERDNLNYTLKKFEEVISDTTLKIKNLREIYKFDYDAYLDEKKRLEIKLNRIISLKETPYFARIDFNSKDNELDEKCYIGKVGVTDYDNKLITVDWRAPIANLYYDSNIGDCNYNAPEGIIEGSLTLKRQYSIEKKELIGFSDVDTVSNDELLKPYLNVSADTRLKNIVSTIQAEQNKIIREKIAQNLIIQGVAGSGKTTVALHRIAYLVYNHLNIFKPSDYMVIGPNKFFVNYISGILPDLDVNGVAEYTLEELLNIYLNNEFVIDNLLDVINPNSLEYSYKVSMNMKYKIDEYFKNLDILPKKDFTIDDQIIITKEKIKEIYLLVNEKIFVDVESKINHLIILLSKYINENINNIILKLILKNTDKKIIDNIKNNHLTYLKKYFKVLNVKVSNIYNEILAGLKFKKIYNKIDITDIPSLLYIKYQLSGNEMFKKYKHIVIDEAQDYGVFTFYVLKKLMKNASFSIYGDLAQSLYSYRSIENWNEVDTIFENTKMLKLNKSYRTTIEIMNEANKINKELNLDEAIPVIRHGDEVEYTSRNIIEILAELKKNYNTISVITKTQEEANLIYNEIKDNIEINLVDLNNWSYDNKINILPSYLAKGLEFDAVIIKNTNNVFKEDINDLKLMYVSMTRALHKLIIIN